MEYQGAQSRRVTPLYLTNGSALPDGQRVPPAKTSLKSTNRLCPTTTTIHLRSDGFKIATTPIEEPPV